MKKKKGKNLWDATNTMTSKWVFIAPIPSLEKNRFFSNQWLPPFRNRKSIVN